MFQAEVEALCSVYAAAPALHEQGVHVISCDEKTGIQAIEREVTPMQQGKSSARTANTCVTARSA